MTASVLFDVPGPKAIRRHRIIGVVGSIALLALAVAVAYGLREQLLPAKWTPLFEPSTWTAYLLPGLLSTLGAAAVAVATSISIGLLLGLGRLSHCRSIRWPSGVIVEFFRAVPVLMMMLFSYYAFRALDIFSGDTLSLAGVVTGLTLYNSCVIAELIRAGVHSLPKGQREAGVALGLTRFQTLVSILLPQAITAMLPSLIAQLIVVLKDTTLGTMIAYSDLLRSAGTIDAVYGNLIPVYIVIGAIFFLLNWSLTKLAEWFEGRARKHESHLPNEPAAPDIEFIQDDLPQLGHRSGWTGAVARVIGTPTTWIPKPKYEITNSA